jgi:hypothetical protein
MGARVYFVCCEDFVDDAHGRGQSNPDSSQSHQEEGN